MINTKHYPYINGLSDIRFGLNDGRRNNAFGLVRMRTPTKRRNLTMKKFTALLAAVIFLTGCSDYTQSDVSDESNEATNDTQFEASAETYLPEYDTDEAGEDAVLTAAALPTMDGSTSATPLEAGLKAELLGITYDEANELVTHTKTHESFQRLIDGDVDLIFTVPISAEQQQAADEAGVRLTSVPVAMEGFVFVVNADNPVDSLTSDQIRKIYSGEITNWSEVGGDDAPIEAYQRNSDSGSQNYMTEFMGDVPLAEPSIEHVAGGMGSLMDCVANYDNSINAIGYSVYSYAAQMYANANKIKLVAIDGVEPSKATMSDGTYPLLSCTYIMYTDKADKAVLDFAEWAVSDDGQMAVLKSGYLPVNGMEIPDEYMPYEAVGTGAAKPDDYSPNEQYEKASVQIKFGDDGYPYISFFKDSELNDMLTEELTAATQRLGEYYDEVCGGEDSGEFVPKDVLNYETYCINGYLSVVIGYAEKSGYYGYAGYAETGNYTYAEAFTIDLIEGKKIEKLSDLFYEGEDFVPALNNAISDYIAYYYAPDPAVVQKIDFSGILGEPSLFTITSVGMPKDNPYFYNGGFLAYYTDNTLDIVDMMVIGEYRSIYDMVWSAYARTYVNTFSHTVYETEIAEVEGTGVRYKRAVSSRYKTDEEISEYNTSAEAMIRQAVERLRDIGYEFDQWAQAYILEDSAQGLYKVYFSQVELGYSFYFDSETKELVEFETLFGENWKDYVDDKHKGMDIIPVAFSFNNGKPTVYYSTSENIGVIYEIANYPMENMNTKYFAS